MDGDFHGMLTRLVALSPSTEVGANAALRATCAAALGLEPLPAEGSPDADAAVIEFAEQFTVDVASLTAAQRGALTSALGARSFTVVALAFIADFVPRVQAGLTALGLRSVAAPDAWDRVTEPVDLLLNGFAPMVGAARDVDPVTTEVVRLRGAVAHDCRLCRSLREGAALDAGGNETMYDDIERYEESSLLNDRHKAALRYVDAIVWTPARIPPEVAAGVRAHFTEGEALELTLDVMRNATNKIAVALGADAPRVTEGVERYLLGVDGQPVYS